MVPALLLTYFVALIGLLFITGSGITGWTALVGLAAMMIIERELFQFGNLIEGEDESSEEPHHHPAHVPHAP